MTRRIVLALSLSLLLAVLWLGITLGNRAEPSYAVTTTSPVKEVDMGYVTTTSAAPTTTTPAPARKRMVGEWPWDAVAECESGGDWSYNGSSGSDGGLQFHPTTWSAYSPPDFPLFAWQATREQQIFVASLVLADQGWNAWPTCSRRLGLR